MAHNNAWSTEPTALHPNIVVTARTAPMDTPGPGTDDAMAGFLTCGSTSSTCLPKVPKALQ